MVKEVQASFDQLRSFCEREEFKGWDPYDGLNSSIFKALQFDKIRIARLAWIQLFKRSPINLRKLTLVKKDYNPKGLGLFITTYCNLYKISPSEDLKKTILQLVDEVMKLRTPGFSGDCWGYNFPWQSRAFYQPKYSPTVVASTFIGCALLDAYDILGEERLLKSARSVCDFILKDLNRTEDEDGNFMFSYSPIDNTEVLNASLLGSKMLSRVYSYTKEEELLGPAKKSVQRCCNLQAENGSWRYGMMDIQIWVDSFHTGYNLECIYEYQKHSGDTSYQSYLDKGLKYYIENFFTDEGIPKYYDNQTYPIDVHAPAQMLITLYRMKEFDSNSEMIDRVLKWSIENFQDKDGFFYYQLKKTRSSKIPYIRWAQAWMMYSLSFYLLQKNGNTFSNS